MFDSGVRTGAAVFKALALGAKFVFVGRMWIWGLSIMGEHGVRHVMKSLLADFDILLGVGGFCSVDEIHADALGASSSSPFVPLHILWDIPADHRQTLCPTRPAWWRRSLGCDLLTFVCLDARNENRGCNAGSECMPLRRPSQAVSTQGGLFRWRLRTASTPRCVNLYEAHELDETAGVRRPRASHHPGQQIAASWPVARESDCKKE